MRWVLALLMTGSVLAGCSAHSARMNGGYASPDDRLDPVRKTNAPGEDPGKEQSVRDFAQPRGLY